MKPYNKKPSKSFIITMIAIVGIAITPFLAALLMFEASWVWENTGKYKEASFLRYEEEYKSCSSLDGAAAHSRQEFYDAWMTGSSPYWCQL